MNATPVMKLVWWKTPLARKLAIPAAGVAAFFLLFILGQNRSAKEEDVAKEASVVAAETAADNQLQRLIEKGVVATIPPQAPPKQQPDYDFLTCTHTVPEDRECVPYESWPLTTEAQELIGWQGGIRDGALLRDATRDIVNQIRNMPDVPACDLYLGLEIVKDPRRPSDVPLERTVYSGQTTAPPGAVKMYDCTPKAKTPVTAPTQGGA